MTSVLMWNQGNLWLSLVPWVLARWVAASCCCYFHCCQFVVFTKLVSLSAPVTSYWQYIPQSYPSLVSVCSTDWSSVYFMLSCMLDLLLYVSFNSTYSCTAVLLYVMIVCVSHHYSWPSWVSCLYWVEVWQWEARWLMLLSSRGSSQPQCSRTYCLGSHLTRKNMSEPSGPQLLCG